MRTRFNRRARKKYSGIDPHPDNGVVTVTDEPDRVVAEKRRPNDPQRTLGRLIPWRKAVASGPRTGCSPASPASGDCGRRRSVVHRPLRRRQLRLPCALRRQYLHQQRQEEGRREHQERQPIPVLGLRRGGPLRAALRRRGLLAISAAGGAPDVVGRGWSDGQGDGRVQPPWRRRPAGEPLAPTARPGAANRSVNTLAVIAATFRGNRAPPAGRVPAG